jgi:hypothetical protein
MEINSFNWNLWLEHSASCVKNATKLGILVPIKLKLTEQHSFFAIKLQKVMDMKCKIRILENNEDLEWKTHIKWVCVWAVKLESVYGKTKIINDLKFKRFDAIKNKKIIFYLMSLNIFLLKIS